MRRSEYLKASPPMFRSGLLDRLTRVHPAVPVLLYLPAIVVLYAVGTLTEYWLHRVVFHFEPEKGLGARLHWMIHGVHHDHPNDRMRLVMPPAASIPLAILVVGAIWLIAGSTHAPAVAAGFLAGYIVYDEIHYALHHHVPKTRLGKRLR